MKRIISALAIASTTLVLPAFAQTNQPGVSVPSAQNSGAGIPGYRGNKNGPAAAPQGGTVGSAARPDNPTVRNQDPAHIQGLPGNKSGPPARPPSGSGK